MPIYRYRLTDPTLARLPGEVPGTPTVGAPYPAIYVDVTVASGSKDDLDAAMTLRGYTYDSTDPVNSPQDAAQAAFGTLPPALGQFLTMGDGGGDGDPGPPGASGAAGAPGQTGPQGETGPQGPATFLLDEAYDGEPGPPGLTQRPWPWWKVRVVDSKGFGDHTTIQAAVDAAASGSVILVMPGTYPEQVTIDKVLSVIGLAPSTYSWDSSAVVINPTITLGQAAITLTSNAGLSVFQNLRVASQHQTGVLDSYGVLVQSMAGDTTYWDNCVVAPEIVSGASPATRVRSVWMQTNSVADFRDCQLGVDDPSNIATEVPPVVLIGTAKMRLLNSRVRTGLNTPGDVSIQDTSTLELVASIIEGTLDEGGTNNTTTYLDSSSRINAVSGDYTDDDAQTKLVHREYGLVDTGGQKDQYKLNLRNLAGDASTLGNGDLWYSTVRNRFRIRQNGASYDLRGVWDCAKIRTVCAGGGADYTTIQAAIDAATSGDTIFIAPGTYNESLTLKDGVDLYGLAAQGDYGVQVTRTVTSSADLVTAPATGGCNVENISFRLTTSTAGLTCNVLRGSGGYANFRNCYALLTAGAATGTHYTVQPASTALRFNHCTLGLLNTLGTLANAATVYTATGSVDLFDTSVSMNASGSSLAAVYLNGGTVIIDDVRINTTGGYAIFRNAGTVNIQGPYRAQGFVADTNDSDDFSGTAFAKSYLYPYMLTDGTSNLRRLRLRSLTADPTSADGDIWYNSTERIFKRREGGAIRPLCSGCPGLHMLAEGGAGEDGPPGPPGPQGPQGTPGGTSAGGSNTQVQYNNGGVLAGDADLTWDAANNELGLNGDVLLSSISTPATPAAGRLKLFARTAANRVVPAVIGPSGVDYPLQSGLFAQSIMMLLPLTGTTITNWGMSGTIVGTASHPTLANTNLLTAMRRTRFASSTTAGSFAGFRGTALMVWRGNAAGLGGFMFGCRFAMTTNLANVRAFCGLYSATAAMANADPSGLLNIIGMSLDSADANWQVITNDNAGAATKTDLGANFAKNVAHVYEFRMFCAPNGSEIYWQVENMSTGNVSSGTFLNTNLPQNTVFLNAYLWITNNATASAAQIEFNRCYLEADK